MATQRAQSIDRLWSPAHGIIFSRGETAVATSNSRALSTSSLSTFEKPTAAIEETYILSNAENSNSSISQPSEKPSSSPPSSGDSSWLPPSNISARSLQVEPLQPESSQAELQEAKTRISEVLENQKEDGEDAETHIPLSFAIPPDIFAAAKAAEPGTADSFWTHKLYTGPDAAKVKVHYCKSRHTTEAVLQKHFLNKPILGFDIEWKMDSSRYASAKKNVSLIQIACEDRIILSHLALFPRDTLQELVAPTLKRIMEDENVTKCGVAIKADCTRLRKFLNIDVKGIFELSHLHRLIKYSDSGEYGLINKKLVSLTAQAEEHLELPIFKGEVRGSDWSEPLNMEQILCMFSCDFSAFPPFSPYPIPFQASSCRDIHLTPHRRSIRLLRRLHPLRRPRIQAQSPPPHAPSPLPRRTQQTHPPRLWHLDHRPHRRHRRSRTTQNLRRRRRPSRRRPGRRARGRRRLQREPQVEERQEREDRQGRQTRRPARRGRSRLRGRLSRRSPQHGGHARGAARVLYLVAQPGAERRADRGIAARAAAAGGDSGELYIGGDAVGGEGGGGERGVAC